MATIRSRGNKQWQAMVRRHGWPDQSKTFNTKAEAETWGRMVEGEMDRGVFVSRDESEVSVQHICSVNSIDQKNLP